MQKTLLLACLACTLALPVRAQHPAADPADVASVDAILAAVYEVISGPVGVERDWDRFYSLFIPEARLIPVGPRDEGVGVTVLSPQAYVDLAAPYFKENAFYEVELHRVQESFGHMVHAFSTYTSRHDPSDAVPFARGINSFQLFHDGSRWWIVTIFWDTEQPGRPLPAAYLPR